MALFAVIKRHLPAACFTGDRDARLSAWRDYERACWADAVQLRGLRLSSFDGLERLRIETEIDRRRPGLYR